MKTISGITDEYTINPTCEATVVIPAQEEKKEKAPSSKMHDQAEEEKGGATGSVLFSCEE